MVRVHPRFYARVFQVPVPKRAAELKAIAGNADRGGPLVAPPAVIEHACGGLHVVPQEFSVKFPMGNRLHAQIECERNVVLVALQVFLENVRNERNHIGPFKSATGAVGIFVRVREFLSGAPIKGRFRNTQRNVLGQVQIQAVYMHVLAEVLLFEKLHGVLRVNNGA